MVSIIHFVRRYLWNHPFLIINRTIQLIYGCVYRIKRLVASNLIPIINNRGITIMIYASFSFFGK